MIMEENVDLNQNMVDAQKDVEDYISTAKKNKKQKTIKK